MKDSVYRARCIEKALNQHSSLDIMLSLADIALDIFLISLKENNETLTKEEIRQKIKEFTEWKKPHQKNNLQIEQEHLFNALVEEWLDRVEESVKSKAR